MKREIKKILSLSPYGIYRLFQESRLEKRKLNKRKTSFKNYFSSGGKKKLHIGCGSNLLEGWLNTDLNWGNKVAYLNAAKKFPFPDKSFDFIYSEHLFEHLNEAEQLNMLTECFRILNVNGVLRIATPSLDFLFSLYSNPDEKLNNKYINWAMNHSAYLYNVKVKTTNTLNYTNYVINHFFKAWGHQMIHNKESLIELGRYCGFSGVKLVDIGNSEYSELNNVEKHDAVIPVEMNKLETMVIELKK